MDVVVTVPKRFGLETWIAEGDPAGTPWSGQEWHFYLWGTPPQIVPGERVYIIYNGALRGYAPLVRIDREDKRYGLVRHGDAVAVSLPICIPGFRNFRYRWWRQAEECPFPDWHNPDAALFDRLSQSVGWATPDLRQSRRKSTTIRAQRAAGEFNRR